MNPQEEYTPDSNENIRPNLRAINGGGESTPGRGNLKSADDVRAAEETGDPNQAINHKSTVTEKAKQLATDTASGKGPIAFIRKRGATIALTGALGITGAGISLFPLSMPFQIGSLIKDKIGQLTNSSQSIRSNSSLKSRLFNDSSGTTSIRCAAGIKVFCSYSSMTRDEIAALEQDGYKLYDKSGPKGKPVVADSNGRYKGGAELRSSDGKLKVNMGNFDAVYADVSNTSFRSTMTKVFPVTYSLARDSVTRKVKSVRGLTEDPNWTNTDNETDPKKKALAMEKDLQATQKAGTTPSVDTGDLAQNESIDEEVKKLEQNLADGKSNDALPNDLASVASLPEPSGKLGTQILTGVRDALSPISIANDVCSGHQTAQKIVSAAKLIGTLYTMRVALQYVATIDKVMAGKGDVSEVQALGDSLTKTDQYGDNFGDSVAYNDIAYGKATDKTISIGTSGTGVLALFTSYLTFLSVNKLLDKVNGTCVILQNPASQILASVAGLVGNVVVAVFTGGAGNAALIATEQGARVALQTVIKDTVKAAAKDAAKSFTKDAIKSTLKNAAKTAVKTAGTMMGSVLAGYLAERYFVPYMARLVAGNLYTGNENGVVMMDTIVAGMGVYTAQNSLKRGMQALTPAQYKRSLAATSSYQAQYIADQRASKSPFDTTSPYTALGSIVFQFNSTLSGLNIIKSGNISKASSTIASLINPGNLLSLFSTKAGAISDTDVDALMAQSDDTDLRSMGLAVDSYGNPIVGFPDMHDVETLTPERVAVHLYDTKQIDDNGDPVSGSAYETFKTDCIDATDTKQVSAVLPEENRLPSHCTDETTNNTDQIKEFRLYTFDHPMLDVMDNGIQATDATPAADSFAAVPTTSSSIIGDDYKLDSTTYAYGSRQCVDFVLYRLVKHGVLPGITPIGNGKDVVGNLGKLGFKVDKTPALHAVMSTPVTSQPQYGHTAIVSGINADGSFVVEEYNYTRTLQYDTRTIPASDIASKQMTFAHTETKYK